MKLKLLIIQKDTKDYRKPEYRFIVVDLKKSKKYPQNFVCVLPKTIKSKPKPASNFERIFGEKSKELAKQLLKKAIKSDYDTRTKKVIKERLELYKPKTSKKIKCANCGKLFIQKNRSFRKYSTCYQCYLKRYVKKT